MILLCKLAAAVFVAAVLMLIFKDSILGLVAGVQLSANDMLRPGDWITMSKYGADGYVIEVTLTTVKVQNFDKTITTVSGRLPLGRFMLAQEHGALSE